MSVSVRIPTILRTYTGGESEVSASGATLAEVLDDLDASYAGIKGRILDEAGSLRRFVNVYVGNDDVRFLDNLATPTPDGTQISVIPAVAGGEHARNRGTQDSVSLPLRFPHSAPRAVSSPRYLGDADGSGGDPWRTIDRGCATRAATGTTSPSAPSGCCCSPGRSRPGSRRTGSSASRRWWGSPSSRWWPG